MLEFGAAAGTTTTGLQELGAVSWGTHLCHLYRSAEDLRAVLVPYFRAGLERGEQCLWVTSEPLAAAEARQALARAVPDLAVRERTGQIEILDHAEWYAEQSGAGMDGVLQGWLERERRARDCGFNGLRLTGNTFWLKREQWDEFAHYEAIVHAAFRDRRILALCSYALQRCTTDDILDVLRNHEFALLRKDGELEVSRSATELLAAVDGAGERAAPSPPPVPDHAVYFFREESYPAGTIAEFLERGVAAGGAAAIATGPHFRAIEGELRSRGVDPTEVKLYDAESLLADVRSGAVDARLIRPIVSELMEERSRRGGDVHLYGELVDLLARRGQGASAVRLEQLWNELLAGQPVKLACGYELSSFESRHGAESYPRVCMAHSRVQLEEGAEGQALLASTLADELGRRRLLQSDRARLLEAEREARAQAEATSSRLACLQRVTSALGKAAAAEDLAAVVGREVCPALGASKAFLTLHGDEERRAGFVASQEATRESDRDPLPALESRSGPLWLQAPSEIDRLWPAMSSEGESLAALLLSIADQSFGAIAFVFPEPREFDASERALITDAADQVARALERVRLYEDAERERRRAESASRAKDEFLAMLSHELRNPLAGIRTAAELFRAKTGGDSVLERTVGALERQTQHMAGMVDELLDVSRLIWGKIALERAHLDLRAVLEDAIHDQSERVADRGLRLQHDLGAGSLSVSGDGLRLEQVFQNLLSNAIKFTDPPGTITVRAARGDGYAEVRVKDSGAGIDPGLLPEIFQPFGQAQQTLDRSAGGLGLGLALVKGLVELHGGTVAAESAGPGQGTEVTVRLPLWEGIHAATPDGEQQEVKTLPMLLVEDNQDLAELFSCLLETAGHEVAIARDGEEALEKARSVRPEVVLCDIGLPGAMDGYDVARALRADGDLCGVLLVAMTGYGHAEDVRCARDAGFDDHLTKPVDLEDIQRLLAKRRAAPGSVPVE